MQQVLDVVQARQNTGMPKQALQIPQDPSRPRRCLSEPLALQLSSRMPHLAFVLVLGPTLRDVASAACSMSQTGPWLLTGYASARARSFVQGLPGFEGVTGKPGKQAHELQVPGTEARRIHQAQMVVDMIRMSSSHDLTSQFILHKQASTVLCTYLGRLRRQLTTPNQTGKTDSRPWCPFAPGWKQSTALADKIGFGSPFMRVALRAW